jgi:glyoxylase-like metal-dependent hydrolase (beta-lactamase superfamily II)
MTTFKICVILTRIYEYKHRVRSDLKILVRAFFDETTNTTSYVVSDPDTRRAAVIDPMLDFKLASGRTPTTSADRIVTYVEEHGIGTDWILETHVHADHLSSSQYLQDRLGDQIAIGSGVKTVQKAFRNTFDLSNLDATCGQFDTLFNNGDTFNIGDITGRVLVTLGHTPAYITYVIGDIVFFDDTLFMPDCDTSRTDFPAEALSTCTHQFTKFLSSRMLCLFLRATTTKP